MSKVIIQFLWEICHLKVLAVIIIIIIITIIIIALSPAFNAYETANKNQQL